MVDKDARWMDVADFQDESMVGTNEFGHPEYNRFKANGHTIRRLISGPTGRAEIYYMCIHCSIAGIEQENIFDSEYELGRLLSVECPVPSYRKS